MALTPGVEVAGVSTVFGNARREIVVATVGALAAVLAAEGSRDGFHPFDLVAAVALVEPTAMRCAQASAARQRRATFFMSTARSPA